MRREYVCSAGHSRGGRWEGQNFKRRRFSDTQPFRPSSVPTKYIQPPGGRSPSRTVSEIPVRTMGQDLLLDECGNNGRLPRGPVSSLLALPCCPYSNSG